MSASTYLQSAQDLVKARLSFWEADLDLKRLTALEATFQTSIDDFEETRSLFFERLISIRLDTALQMDKLLAAKRYLTLEESAIPVDPTRDISTMKQDLIDIGSEIVSWKETWDSDKQGMYDHTRASRPDC